MGQITMRSVRSAIVHATSSVVGLCEVELRGTYSGSALSIAAFFSVSNACVQIRDRTQQTRSFVRYYLLSSSYCCRLGENETKEMYEYSHRRCLCDDGNKRTHTRARESDSLMDGEKTFAHRENSTHTRPRAGKDCLDVCFASISLSVRVLLFYH